MFSIRWSRNNLLPTSIRKLKPQQEAIACLQLQRHSASQSHFSTSKACHVTRWKQRQGSDPYAKEARVQGLKSRAAFKLLEIDSKYGIFKRGQTVVDLGYAPGSWSQVAMERSKPRNVVIGIDLIPAQPPPGVATFQGDFLSPKVQELLKDYIVQAHRRKQSLKSSKPESTANDAQQDEQVAQSSYIDKERHLSTSEPSDEETNISPTAQSLVDVVLSDMSAPWEQTTGFRVNSLSNPYRRLMNTSGNAFRDHAGSMDLCNAALQFANDTLRTGGHFICKYYQGNEEQAFELMLKKVFTRVFREKPESSRSESKEAYFVALRRKSGVNLGK